SRGILRVTAAMVESHSSPAKVASLRPGHAMRRTKRAAHCVLRRYYSARLPALQAWGPRSTERSAGRPRASTLLPHRVSASHKTPEIAEPSASKSGSCLNADDLCATDRRPHAHDHLVHCGCSCTL